MKEYIHQTVIDQNIPSRIPGFILVEHIDSNLRANRTIEEGIKRFFGGFGNHAYIYELGRYKFALLMPESLPSLSCVSIHRSNGNFAFIEGTFYDYKLLEENKKDLISNQLGEYILNLCLSKNFSDLKNLNGRYSGFCYVKQTDTLVVITDSYGSNRVFVFEDPSNFVISNNVFALSTNPVLKVTVNEESIAQIIHYEYPAYRQTEFNEIELILPSDILIRKDKVNTRIKEFQKVDRTVRKSDKEHVNELRETINSFFVNLNNYLQEPIGVYLSKGKDSRLFLPFLERNHIPYIPFVFKEDTGVFDYAQVKKISELLEKDLHVMDHHTIDPRLSFLISMSTTHTSAWLALGKVASNYVNTALMGLYGESSSGKLCAYRNYGVSNFETSVIATIGGNSKNITREESIKWAPYYKKFDTIQGFKDIYKDFPNVDLPFDLDTFQDIDHRSFRNAIVILLKSQHFITPISPYMDKHVASVYHNLPHSLLYSQLAHTIIASEEEKSNKINSTAFPITLKNERYIRSLVVELVKFNNYFKNILLKSQYKKYHPYVNSSHFKPRSSYFKSIYNDQKPEYIGNPRIITRLTNIDNYLHLTMEDDLTPYFKSPLVLLNEIEKVNIEGVKQ